MSEQQLKPPVCALCGKTADQNVLMAQGKTFNFICSDCAKSANDLLSEKSQKNEVKKEEANCESNKRKPTTPALIREYLDEYIIEQDSAKKVLATALYNHLLRVKMKDEGREGADEVEKSNVLLVGPSGVGKTALIKRVAKAMGLPFVIEDATSMSATGYVGRDPEAILRDLVDAAGGNIELAKRGIVYIDEIDKTSRKSESPSVSADPTHESLQQALLKVLEGTVVEVSEQRGTRHHPNAPTFKINTENILFIVGGAFEGIERIIAKRQKKHRSSIGFGSNLELNKQKAINDCLDDLEVEDLRKFGILPELLGRLPVICKLKALTDESLARILTEPKNALVKQYQTLFAEYGCKLEFTQEALLAIAKRANEKGTGARALRGLMEEILGDAMFTAPGEDDLCEVLVDVVDGEIIVSKQYEEVEEGVC